MRFMKALVGVAVLSGTTLVTTGAFSQSTDRLSQNTEPVSATFESTEDSCGPFEGWNGSKRQGHSGGHDSRQK